MLDVEETDRGFRAVDAAKNQVEIEIDDWEPGGEELEIGYEVDETITGSGTEIRLPKGGFLIDSSELEQPRMLNMNERVRLGPGDHHFRLGTPIQVLIQTQSLAAATAENTKEGIRLTFNDSTRFSIGFHEFTDRSSECLTIPPTIEGAARAVGACASLHTTETPDRSFPSERPKLPRVEIADEAPPGDCPVKDFESPLRFRIPGSLEFLIPLAPLAFYLGAGVTLERRPTPVLELGTDVYGLPSDSRFPDEVASLLRRVFYLDCLVREVGPRRLGIREFELLDHLPLDADRLYRSSMVERVQAYLETPFETIDADLPEWPLAMYVESAFDSLPAIPFLMDKLSLVFPPKSSPLDKRTLVERSLGDFYRSATSGSSPDSVIEVSDSGNPQSRVQGWIAQGNPVDAFKCPLETFENRLESRVDSSEPISINVVLNEAAMHGEFTNVAEIYRDRAEELAIDLDFVEEATMEELARSFESAYDFLHYIGHCDRSGFRCVDGYLSVEQLSESKVKTFFLNACGSYHEGLELIRKGSVAGGVTFGDVIDTQAAKVGMDFARLYMIGYAIERALYHARGQAIMNRQYAIVGDGTHVLTQGDSIQPTVIHVHRNNDGTYSTEFEAAPINLAGGVLIEFVASEPNLMGNQRKLIVDKSELEELLRCTRDPVIYEGNFYWPEELLEELF